MLTDIRALADHFLIALPNINTWRWNLFEVSTSCFGGMAIPCWRDYYPVFLIGVDPWTIIIIRIVS